jgi:transposase-like protein
VAEVLPLLYLHGMSSGDFAPALEEFFGAPAGLSASVITRLTVQWQTDREAFMARSLADRDDVYVWADGVHFNVRLAEERLCTLVIIGVRSDGTKELVAIADGLRESTESWAELLRDLRRRGMQAPVLASATAPLAYGQRCGTCSPPPGPSVAGSTRPRMCWPRSPPACTLGRGGR